MKNLKQTLLNECYGKDLEQLKHWYSPAAQAYQQSRPRYPQALIDRAVEIAQLSSSTLLEVGCGPAIATPAFAALGCRMVCVEPNPDFYCLAQQTCKPYPNVELQNCSFEEWELEPQKFDAVVAASSFHLSYVSAFSHRPTELNTYGSSDKRKFIDQTGCDCSRDRLFREERRIGSRRESGGAGVKHQAPAIYKHLDGNAGLRRAVALAIWRNYLTTCRQQTDGITEPQVLFRVSAHATRNFARSHPALYTVMMQYQMRPTDPEEAEIIQDSLHFFQKALQLYELSYDSLIDVMRMVNAAIYGFIIREQSELMTLDRSSEASYEVMLEALLVAIAHIKQINP